MTAHANVALAAGPGWSGADVQNLLARLGLAMLSQRRPSQLSGGQQQRVALARALVRVMPAPSLTASPAHLPGVLLLDEPFSAVDAPTRQTLYRELAALRQNVSVPMVLVTHDLQEARRLADRVVIVDAGQTLQTGAPARVFASPRNARVAELVGIQNHFEGRFVKGEAGWGRLRWTDPAQPDAGLELTVFDKNKIDEGTLVTWVLNGEQVDVIADGELLSNDEPGQTRLRCQLLEVLSLGEISLCTLEPEALSSQTITLNLTTRLLDRLQVKAGGWVQLMISPGALHIMPVRTK
jgi:molybdate transport system ATP-binding protein